MSTTKKKEGQKKTESFSQGVVTYLKGVRSEWHKVTWPERRQIVVETLIVLGVVFFFSVFVYLLDTIFRVLLPFSTRNT